MKLDLEEKILIEIIFKNSKLTKDQILKANLEKLTIIASSHLMLPCLYFKIKEKKYLNYFPDEFTNYLKEIYQINKNRNNQGLIEIKELSKLFNDNCIDHVFLKGAAMLAGNLYKDLGERMIFDIDFLVKKKDQKKIKEILLKNSYQESKEILFFNDKHLPKMYSKKKLFGIEPHLKLLDKRNNLVKIEFDKTKLNRNNLPKRNDLLNHTIYNYQINDSGYSNFSYSYRSIFDTIKILDDMKTKEIYIESTKESVRYFDLIRSLGVDIGDKLKIKSSKINIVIFKLIKKFNFLHKLILLSNFVKQKLFNFPRQCWTYLKNKNYRIYLRKRLNF